MAGPVISLEDGWRSLKAGVVKFQQIIEDGCRDNFTIQEHLALYTTCYSMCTQKSPDNHADELYKRYGEVYEEYLNNKVLPAIKAKHGEAVLDEFALRWKNHKLLVRQLSRLFVYLDRFHVKRVSAPPLKEVGVQKFEQLVFDAVQADVREGVLALIQREREGELVDKAKIKAVVDVFVEIGDWRPLFPTRPGEELGDIGPQALNIYIRLFEEPFLVATAQFYGRESSRWIDDDSCPEFLKKAEARLEQEMQRVHAYLHHTSDDKLLKTTLQQLLARHQQVLMDKENSGVESLLRENKVDDLARMYNLFYKLPSGNPNIGLVPLGVIVRKHITEVGMALVRKESMEKDHGGYITQLLDLHQKYLTLVNGPFQGNAIFQKVLKEAFEVFVNKDVGQATTAELLSSFCDSLMKTGGDKLEGEIDTLLDRIVALFSYLGDKDMFAEFYRKQLAKRLLLGRSASDDNERSFITKLKYRCGAQFTSKLEGMVTDMNVSQDTQSNFMTWLQNGDIKLGLDLTVTVLTTGYWPTYKVDDIILPSELSACVQSFACYYGKRTAHRKLRWVHTLGTTTLQGNFTKKRIDLVVSTYQAVILLLLNHADTYTHAEIAATTKLPSEPLKRCLESFTSKTKIMLKDPPAPTEHADTDVYAFNPAFDDARRRIKMSLLVTKVTQDEKTATKQTVDEDRKHAVEACIVRVMKSRRMLEHQKLIMAVSEQLMQHFKPDPKVIKKRVEDLISREYLERDKDNPSLYKYVA
mmetsp:Transcript_181/g.578  ORF Transcript_181/g.578 Transcript_181/m.578 type:complete len:753 (+) Transcript_181:64-2322(+)